MPSPPARCRRGPWLVGGVAAVLLIAWALTGDAAPGRRAAGGDPQALELLRGTAAAARRTPYEGTWTHTTLAAGGRDTSTTKVAHRVESPPSGTSMQSASPLSERREELVVTAGGLPGLTPEALEQLARNYTVVWAADSVVCGRKARVVEARRPGGGTAGRFWIDAQTGILLQRELLDETGRVVSSGGFAELRITRPRILPQAAAPRARPWREMTAAEVDRLRKQGWSVPQTLPGGLALHQVRRSGSGEDGTLHLGYSDGLAAVSVFVQRGRLNVRRLAGWRRATVAGRTVFRREARQRWVVWAGDGYVYTVLTDAPQATSDAVVAALPRSGAGLWERLWRGARRIGTWAIPWS